MIESVLSLWIISVRIQRAGWEEGVSREEGSWIKHKEGRRVGPWVGGRGRAELGKGLDGPV